jgi:hypothetical protein
MAKELVRIAYLALADLLDAVADGSDVDLGSTPGACLGKLAEAHDALAHVLGQCPETDSERTTRLHLARRARADEWAHRSYEAQVHDLLNAVGEERMTAWEIADRVSEALDAHVYDTRLRPVLKRMVEEGDLVRARMSKPVRWVYFRRVPDVAALEDLYNAEGAA